MLPGWAKVILRAVKHTPTITSVSHLVPTNKSKRSWVFPVEAGILAVDTDQILLKANEELTNFGSS